MNGTTHKKSAATLVRQEVMAVVAVLKRQFAQMSSEQILELAWDVVEAAAKARED